MEAPNDRRGSHLSTRVLLNDDEYIDDESHNYLQSFEQNYEAGDHLRPLPAKSETTLSGVSGRSGKICIEIIQKLCIKFDF